MIFLLEPAKEPSKMCQQKQQFLLALGSIQTKKWPVRLPVFPADFQTMRRKEGSKLKKGLWKQQNENGFPFRNGLARLAELGFEGWAFLEAVRIGFYFVMKIFRSTI